MSRVNVIKPGLTDGVYDYAAYAERPMDALVPLEIIFRFGVPNGSSLMKRVGNDEYLAELGLSTKPNFGDLFEEPVIEYSTKLRQLTDTFQKQRLVQLQDSPWRDASFNRSRSYRSPSIE